MTDKKKPTSWRAKTVQQQRDKQEIYNSREWWELRVRKMRANPFCELCIEEGKAAGMEDGYLTPTQAIHHKHPIEESSTKEEMRKWAFMYDNLLSVCKYHHAKIHREAGANRKENVEERRQLRQARWKQSLLDRFCCKPTDTNEQISKDE